VLTHAEAITCISRPVTKGLQVMAQSISDVRVVGLGKVGELLATLLIDSGFAITAYDFRERRDLPFETRILDLRDTAALTAALLGSDAVVSCVPYHLNLPVAEAAHAAGVHYFDLTEDVPTTNRVLELVSNDPKIVYVPHCGLAPGLIGIVGSWLAKDFPAISRLCGSSSMSWACVTSARRPARSWSRRSRRSTTMVRPLRSGGHRGSPSGGVPPACNQALPRPQMHVNHAMLPLVRSTPCLRNEEVSGLLPSAQG